MHGDPGVGNARTALAWQRTALALVAGSVILARLTFDRLGILAFTSVLVVLPLSCWVLIESRARYAQAAGRRQRTRSRGGRAPAALTIATMVLALVELAALVAEPERS